MCIRNSTIFRRVVALSGAILFAAISAQADPGPYRLVPGDRIGIYYMDTETVLEAQVDLDGQIRLADVGGVTVAGLTLDEAEDFIETRLVDAALYIDARANVSLIGYAPIVVTGDIVTPGRYDFIPGMTISSAVGAAGGSVAGGISNLDLARTTSDLRARLRLINLEVAAIAVRTARLEATLADEVEVALSPALTSSIPLPEAVRLAVYVASEEAILINTNGQTEELLAAWDEEIDALSQQQRLLELRLESQAILVANAEEAFANAQILSERGLQTTAALSAVEQNLVTARARIFELESLQVTLVTSISEAVRARALYLRRVQEEALVALNDARIDLDDARMRYSQVIEQLALLSSGNVAALLDDALVELSFTISSPRRGRSETMELTSDTPLLPGDTLMVHVMLRTPVTIIDDDTGG